MTGFLYAMRAGDVVKLGYSENPSLRLNKVNSDAPVRAALVGQVAATKEQEAALHALIKPWRVNGEWYRAEGPIAWLLDMMPPPPVKARPAPIASKLHVYLNDHGIGEGEFAAIVGCSAFAVRKWRYGQRFPRPAVLQRISAATNGAVTANDFIPADPLAHTHEASQ